MSWYAGARKLPMNGLKLCLDASNQKSFGVGQTTWKDLSGNAHNVPLVGASYSSVANGCVAFDGVDDDGELNGGFFSFVGLSNYSVSMWVNLDISTDNVDVRFFWHGNYGMIFYKSTNDNYIFYINTTVGAKTAVSSPYSDFGNWVHLVGTYDGSNVIGYWNGEIFDSEPHSGTLINVNGLPDRIRIGSSGTSFFGKMNMNNILVYDRTLTQNEINQIFNAQKGRYGVV